ncbi:MAG: SDR family NAD(P)-dependent oxidoreductase [Magnetococcales bacterium]|nr:SDR family NAD(P)-dependent oxidoreductase [Magnetococcales bacterium]
MEYGSGKNILITGCSTGIGHCVAQGLKARGWRVFATARKMADVDKLKKEGFESCQIDLDNSYSIHSGVQWVLEQSDGRLDALFNNGAYGQPGAMEDITRQAIREQFETNVFGTHELTSLILPVMRAQGYGRIIQNSSILGFVAMPFRGAYVASKFAINGLTEAMRVEMQGSGIDFILIEPGPIRTEFRKNAREAFLKFIKIDKSPYQEKYQGWIKIATQEEAKKMPFSLPPEAVLEKVIKALESKTPKTRYGVTTPTHVFWILRCILPRRWLDKILLKAS